MQRPALWEVWIPGKDFEFTMPFLLSSPLGWKRQTGVQAAGLSSSYTSERYSGWRQQSRGGKRSGTSIMHAAAFLFSCQIKRKNHILPLDMLHENDKTNIKSLPWPWWKIERGMHIYFVYLLWYLGKLRLRYIKWLAQDHLVNILSYLLLASNYPRNKGLRTVSYYYVRVLGVDWAWLGGCDLGLLTWLQSKGSWGWSQMKDQLGSMSKMSFYLTCPEPWCFGLFSLSATHLILQGRVLYLSQYSRLGGSHTYVIGSCPDGRKNLPGQSGLHMRLALPHFHHILLVKAGIGSSHPRG